jgi:hypothetical protein
MTKTTARFSFSFDCALAITGSAIRINRITALFRTEASKVKAVNIR